MSDVLVSVIVPAYNSASTLTATLKAILSQQVNFIYEVIVVDDGSTDQTADIVKKFPNIIYLYQENAGPASARNSAARLGKGQFFAFTDSDCVPHHDWLTQLLAGFSIDDIGVVSGSYGIVNKHSCLARCIHKEILFRHQHLMPDFPKAFGGYNFCVRKNVFQSVGGFSEQFRKASGEDNDLSYKILKSGQHIFFNSHALVDHVHPESVWRYLNEQSRHGYWRVVMYAQHPEMMKGDDYTFWKDIIEMPWVCLSILSFALTITGGLSFEQTILYIFLPFYIFEICAGIIMTNHWIDGIIFGNITFLRAFARFFGLSTGIYIFFIKKIRKKIK